MDEWEEELIQNLTFKENCSHANLIVTLYKKDFILVTDGLAKDGEGTFGWLLATLGLAQIMLKNTGWVCRAHPSSYCTEIIGILLLKCFLIQFAKYCKIKLPSNLLWLCDNKSPINKFKKIKLVIDPS